MCDATCLAAPGIIAAGDVARWPNAASTKSPASSTGTTRSRWARTRRVGCCRSTPRRRRSRRCRYFWSDQYDRKIQLAGRPRPDDEVHIATGSLDERRFAALYGRAGKLVAVLGINRPRHVAQYRQLIVDGASFDDALAFARQS